eukprot:TRINITY_DN17730_c0_g2_i2.p1 TRINITY_DN17730_c0_g2~~TRINITY_DN17730_c0_g2_i2.p1  ORF type:complete len:409 (-),score=41.19 TRINITY_DN17730_c0_g2_i2:104-1330(-)
MSVRASYGSYHHPDLLDTIQHPSPHRPALLAAKQQLSQHQRELHDTEAALLDCKVHLGNCERRVAELRELVRQAELDLEGSMEREAQYAEHHKVRMKELQLNQRACWGETDARMMELILGRAPRRFTRLMMCGCERETRELISSACDIMHGLEQWEAGDHREAADVVIDEMVELNPKCSEEALRSRLLFNDDGTCCSWSLNGVGLCYLPEEFGMVRMDGSLDLARNQLSSLPESFGDLRVGGTISLTRNKLSCLPESFGYLRVGKISMSYNQLSSLPESFGNLHIGGDIFLRGNKLSSLPESFGNLHMGGTLSLRFNELSSLPESFGNLRLRGRLRLSHNQLGCLPESFGNLHVGSSVHLESNQLSSLPESFRDLHVGGDLYLPASCQDVLLTLGLLGPHVQGEASYT